MPQWYFGEYRALDPVPFIAMLCQKPRPQKGAEDLGVEVREVAVVLISRIRAIKHPIQIATGNATLGLDIQHVQESVPIFNRSLVRSGKSQVVEFKQIERGDDAKQLAGVLGK